MSKRATPRTRTPLTSRPSRAVRDALEGKQKLLFGLPIGQSPPPPIVVFWLHVLNGRQVLTREGAYSIAAAHNGMVEEALKLPRAMWQYLVWLEADHTFNAHDVFPYIEHLDAKRYPIVGFLYVERQMPCLPVGFDRDEEGLLVRWGEERMAEFERRPGLHQVSGGVPMGVTAVHRSVFEKVPRPWYYDPPDGSMSDDIWFCQQAIKAGFPVHVATQFDIGHWGSARYDRRHYWAGVEFDRKKVALAAEELLRKRIDIVPMAEEAKVDAVATRDPGHSDGHSGLAPEPAPNTTSEGTEGEAAYTYRDRRRVTA